jgi:hypothetical protein
MKRLVLFFSDLLDRLFPLLAICGFIGSVGLVGDSTDFGQYARSFCALVLSLVAMWAFWGEPNGNASSQD